MCSSLNTNPQPEPDSNPTAKSPDPPHRSKLNVACGAGRMAETNDSSRRWGPWAELGLASGAAACRTEGPRREGRRGCWEGWLMGPQTARLDLTGLVHSLLAG